MKYILVVFFAIITWTNCIGQELATIRDTVNHFEIGVPIGWLYGVPADKSITFIALRQKQNDQDIPRENFNINIFRSDYTDFNQSYEYFLENIGRAKEFKIIDQGETIIHNRKYRYLMVSHINPISNEKMYNHVLFTNSTGKVFILTMVTTYDNVSEFKDLFTAIALSLKY